MAVNLSNLHRGDRVVLRCGGVFRIEGVECREAIPQLHVPAKYTVKLSVWPSVSYNPRTALDNPRVLSVHYTEEGKSNLEVDTPLDILTIIKRTEEEPEPVDSGIRLQVTHHAPRPITRDSLVEARTYFTRALPFWEDAHTGRDA